MSAQAKRSDSSTVVERLRHYQVSQGMTWQQIADKFQLSRGMLMMVLRGDRKLSAKALFKLEEAEREAADVRSAAERIVETLIGGRNIVAQIVGHDRKLTGKGKVDVAVQYETGRSSRSLPAKISLSSPAEEDCLKLRSLFAETLDARVMALACLPPQLRSEAFLDQLTSESRARLTNAAIELVIPDWRTLVTKNM